MTDMKMTDHQKCKHEIAGHDFDGPSDWAWKCRTNLPDVKLQDMKLQDMKG